MSDTEDNSEETPTGDEADQTPGIEESENDAELPSAGIDLLALGRLHPAANWLGDSFTKIDLSWVGALESTRIYQADLARSWADAVSPALARINQSMAQQIAKAVSNLMDFSNWWSSSLDVLAHGVGDFLDRYYPENWHGIDRPTAAQLDVVVLGEGIPLCWVPPGDIVEKLVTASTEQARRDVLGRSWARILDSCEESLNHVTSRTGLRYVRFARASIRAIRDGHRDAGQSLAINTLDTLVSRYGLKPPGENKRPDIDKMDIKDALVLGGLWSTYFSFRADSPDVVAPRPLRRHASAHAVSAQQYSLRNATLAAMHLVSVLRWLEINGHVHHGKALWR